MTAVMNTSHAHRQHEHAADVRKTSVDQKREELDHVEKQLERAKANLSRLKRYWSQLEDVQRDELLDRLEQRDSQERGLFSGSTSVHSSNAVTLGVSSSSTSGLSGDAAKVMKKAKKKVIVGNTSSFVPEDHREETDQFTHKWMIYVRGPKEEPDLSWVKKVRIKLHPSFAPNDIVDLHSPPFHLSRRGYGEFPVNVQLFLFDPRAEPIKITHNLTLDKESTGKQIIGPETVVEVEMDESALSRRHASEHGATEVTTSRISSAVSTPPSKRQRTESVSTPSSPFSSLDKSAVPTRTAQSKSEIIIPSHPCMKYDNQLWREMSEEEKLIHDAATKYPIIVADGNAPYMCAVSNDEFMSWTIGKRKACERFRALYVQSYVKTKFQRDIKVVDISRFCRLAGLSPVVVQNDGLEFLLNQDDDSGDGSGDGGEQ